jgi:hypothetical protein
MRSSDRSTIQEKMPAWGYARLTEPAIQADEEEERAKKSKNPTNLERKTIGRIGDHVVPPVE